MLAVPINAANLNVFTVIVLFRSKYSRNDTNSPLSVIFLKPIMIILSDY